MYLSFPYLFQCVTDCLQVYVAFIFMRGVDDVDSRLITRFHQLQVSIVCIIPFLLGLISTYIDPRIADGW